MLSVSVFCAPEKGDGDGKGKAAQTAKIVKVRYGGEWGGGRRREGLDLEGRQGEVGMRVGVEGDGRVRASI